MHQEQLLINTYGKFSHEYEAHSMDHPWENFSQNCGKKEERKEDSHQHEVIMIFRSAARIQAQTQPSSWSQNTKLLTVILATFHLGEKCLSCTGLSWSMCKDE
jgi:hypothetical protein